MAWYKTFWLIEGFYALNYGAASIFVIVPFYFEQNYNVSFIYSWWHWYSRVFFFQFIASYSVILLMGHLLQINLRWINWKKGVIPILLINIFIAYLIYTHFIMVFFWVFYRSSMVSKIKTSRLHTAKPRAISLGLRTS